MTLHDLNNYDYTNNDMNKIINIDRVLPQQRVYCRI
jgi:hypothetical protein